MPILADNEPPFFTLTGSKDCRLLITLEHASNAIPASLDNLGLSNEDLQKHIAYDLYIKEVALEIHKSIDCHVIGANFSRLVVDCNRTENSPALIAHVNDGIEIPGNMHLSDEDQNARIREIHTPYHKMIETILETMDDHAFVIDLHSFCPRLHNEEEDRIWDIGLLWEHDKTLAEKIGKFLKENYPDLIWDYDVPYNARLLGPTSMSLYAGPRNIPAVNIELAQKSMAIPEKRQRIVSALIDFLKSNAL